MTKTVFTNDGLVHAFASGNVPNGRTANNNFYFVGDTLYSYGSHYPVVHVDRTKKIAYFNADHASVTTEGKHKNKARRALRHFTAVDLPALDTVMAGGFCQLRKDELARYIQSISDQMDALTDKRSRMRATWRIACNEREELSLHDAAQTVWKLHKRRGNCFSVSARDTKAEREDRTKRHLTRGFNTIEHRLASVDGVLAELAQDQAVRADVWSYKWVMEKYVGTLHNLYAPLGFGRGTDEGGAGESVSRKAAVRLMGADWVKRAETIRDQYYYAAETRVAPALKAKIAETQDTIDALIADDMEAWVNGKGLCAPSGASMTLRIHEGALQMSAGAEVPLDEAIALTRAAAACRAHNKAWKRNGERKRVGRFECDAISAQGDITAGCHFISWRATAACVTRFASILPADLVAAVTV
jgi:outer membrane murein-binding lipoprotein Lpp